MLINMLILRRSKVLYTYSTWRLGRFSVIASDPEVAIEHKLQVFLTKASDFGKGLGTRTMQYKSDSPHEVNGVVLPLLLRLGSF